MKRLIVGLALLGLLLPVAAVAQETAPITWLSYAKAKHNQGMPATGVMVKQLSPVFDKLVADGHAASWGIAMPIAHGPNDPWTHMTWVTTNGWSGVAAMDKAFAEHFGTMAPEQAVANQTEWDAVIEPGSHYDFVMEQTVFWIGDSAPKYLVIGTHEAKAGKAEELTKLFEEFAKPVYDQLGADGTISGYGLGTPALHAAHVASHTGWYGIDDLSRIPAVDAAFAAAMAADPARIGKLMEITDWSAHTDTVLMIVHMAPGSGEGE